jgi:hypothetical protein
MSVFQAKRLKTGKQKQLWQPELQAFFVIVFCFVKGSNKNV